MKKRRINLYRGRRNNRGAALIYGVIAVVGILGASAVGTVVILNVGYGTIYNEKLARVSNYAAQYAAAHAQDGTGSGAVQSYTENMMLAMGMTPKNVSINISQTNTENGPSVQVTVANQFTLAGSSGILPSQITLHDTVASATGSND